MAFRRLGGKGSSTCVVRRGLRWHLDLGEGIDFAIWLLGRFEAETVRCYSSLLRSGDIVLDIGANIGAHTLPLAVSVGANGSVIAFEPTDYAFEKLRRNVAANPSIADRIQCVQAMLVDVDCDQMPPPKYSSWPLAAARGAHPEHRGALMRCVRAQATTLDAILEAMSIDRVDCIKLDIDGDETKMLRGAKRTLDRWRPTVIMELAPYVLEEHGSSIEELLDILRERRYELTTLDRGRRISMDASDIRCMIPEGASINVLATALDADESRQQIIGPTREETRNAVT